MINGNEINGAEINGSGLKEVFYALSDPVSISENLTFSKLFNLSIDESVLLSEQINFGFNKGMSIYESVSIGEAEDIQIGNLILHLDDEPVRISESILCNLQKGILMQDQIKYYLDLLIIQYKNKPKAIKHMTTLISAALIDLMPSILNNAFNLETAVGIQLDILGIYIGIKRRVKTFDTDVTLNDDDYRTLLKIKRSTNNIGSSFHDIQDFIKLNLDGVLYAWDHKTMNMSFYMSSILIPTVLAQAIIKQNILPKPMGVSSSSVIYMPSKLNIFGFRDMGEPIGSQVGFNNYSSYNSSYKMIHQENTI